MLGEGRAPCPRGYVPFRSPFDPAVGSHHGVMLCVRHDIPHSRFVLQSPLQAIAVTLHLQKSYTVCSLYLPPNDPLDIPSIRSLIEELPEPFLLLGDFNGRHPLWGDIVTNARGNLISSLLEEMELGLFNTGEPTHFHIQTGTLSAIDLSVCNSGVLLDFT